MPEERRTPEHLTAEMLRGYKFFHHPEMPTVGILRLDTDGQQHFVMVTKQLLHHLADACTKHADDLQETQ